MSSLNGRKIKKGDIVYDILNGAGRVTNDGGGVLNVTVDFGTNGTMNFTQDGKFQGKQSLYWKQPRLFQPRGPDDEPYEKTVELSKIIYDYLVAYETRQNSRK